MADDFSRVFADFWGNAKSQPAEQILSTINLQSPNCYIVHKQYYTKQKEKPNDLYRNIIPKKVYISC